MYAVVTHAYIDEPLQLLDDARHGRRDDGLVERAQQHDDGERGQRQAPLGGCDGELSQCRSGFSPTYGCGSTLLFFLPVHLPSPNEPNTTVPLIVSPVTVPV